MGRCVVVPSKYCTGVVEVDVKAVEKMLDDLLAQ
jgi:hypothetical protein